MIPLAQLLVRFKNLTNTEKVKKQLVSEAVSRILGFSVPHTSISFSKNTVFIKVQPLIKTEILLKKGDILATIKSLPGLEYIQEIR